MQRHLHTFEKLYGNFKGILNSVGAPAFTVHLLICAFTDLSV
jgi:hypothetical protein